MRYVIIIIALMSISLLSAGIFDSTITFPLVTVNPSSTSKALGDVTGVANIWSGDPLNVWSNPALVAFHEGIRIGYMHDLYADDYTDNMGYNKYYQNVAIGSFAKNGLGISVPLPNYNGKIGNTFDYNLSTSGDYKPYMYDTVSEISLAFNPYQFAWNKKSEASEQCFDASVGISVNILSSRYYLDVISEDSFSSHNEHIHGDATEINGGLLLRFDGAKYFHLQNLELQGTFG
ncbi:MAG TPA: hypothetical protein PKK33_09915, partial [Candidatus Cloacimonadota bacterium]|nr:hypothetical protein [Candidatus Cloacimonadota bacterium]